MAGVNALIARLEAMRDPAWRADLSLHLAGTARKLIDDSFSGFRDPYGGSWRQRKHHYPWPMLQKTRDLRNGWRLVQADAQGFRFVNSAVYGHFQQYGTTRGIDPREMFPVEAFGLGQTWQRAFNAAMTSEIRKLLRR
jgi:hypothetical protein